MIIHKFKEYVKTEIKRGHLNLGEVRDDGVSLDVNSLYTERNTKPYIGIMGEYHFVRDDKDNWERELSKIKAGGVGIIATYVFWIYHEETEGKYDFSGDRDLRAFIMLCQKLGLEVIIRIGPWGHGECRNGGFPDWLVNKPYKKRTNDPDYLDEVKRWYGRIYEEVKGLFFRDTGPIIGIQIENELVDNSEHLKRLKEIAVETGFEAPIWTVTGWNRLYGAEFPVKEFLPVFGAYADAPWADHTDKLPPSKHYTFDPTRNDAAIGMDLINDTDDKGWRLPYEDYPFATCEIGSGLPIAYKRRSVISPMDAYALSLVKLGCGNNLVGYYMYHGGTNKIGALSTLQESGATGYPNDYPILNYDFNTCLTQYGEVRGQYRLLNLLHLFINDFGDRLAPMEYTPSESYVNENDKVHLRYCMRTDGESGFVFINHYQRFLSLSDIDDAVIDTGKVVFPPINVRGETAFILPFKLKLGEEELIYSTAQLLCKDRDTVFFASIPGIKPVFSFKDMDIFTMSEDEIEIKKTGDLNIVSIPWEKSLYLRKLDTGVYLGEGCDLYIKDGRISSAEAGDYSYLVWNNGGFERIVCEEGSKARPILTMEPCDEPYSPPFIEEFRLGKERPLKWYSLKADTEDGFISIDLKCDVAQIYADKELRADLFCFGQPWRFPAKLIYGRESYLVCTEFNKDVYIDP